MNMYTLLINKLGVLLLLLLLMKHIPTYLLPMGMHIVEANANSSLWRSRSNMCQVVANHSGWGGGWWAAVR